MRIKFLGVLFFGVALLILVNPLRWLEIVPTFASRFTCPPREWLCLDAKQKIPSVKCPCENIEECDNIPPLPEGWVCPTNQDAGQKDGTGYTADRREYWYFDNDTGLKLEVPPVLAGRVGPTPTPTPPGGTPPPVITPLPLPAGGCRIANFDKFQYYCQTGWGDQYPQRDQAKWCGVTSAAMLYTHANRVQNNSNEKNPEPPRVWERCGWTWSSPACAANLVYQGNTTAGSFSSSDAYFAKLKELVCDQGRPVVANLKRNNVNHFLVVVGLTPTEIETADPWYGCSGFDKYTSQPYPYPYSLDEFYDLAGKGDNPYQLRWMVSP